MLKKSIFYLKQLMLGGALSLGVMSQVCAQNAALATHLNYAGVNTYSDITMNKVMAPNTADYNYNEVLGWHNEDGSGGYAGIQDQGGSSPSKNFIFSIWNPSDPRYQEPIVASYVGPGTIVSNFGGEGEGLKSLNFSPEWAVNNWYNLVSRVWSVGTHTHYGFWVQDLTTNKWTHLITMDYPVPNQYFYRGNDAFIEDWGQNGANARKVFFKDAWQRSKDKVWDLQKNVEFRANDPSGNYANNFNAGVENGSFFLQTGGTTTPSFPGRTANLNVTSSATSPVLVTGEVSSYAVVYNAASKTANATWAVNELKSPQYAYTIEVFSNAAFTGTALASRTDTIPQARAAAVYIPTLTNGTYYTRIKIRDIFDNVSAVKTATLTVSSDPLNCTDPAWNAATAYSGGNKVSYNNNAYVAKWWTQNNQPDLNTGDGKPWTLTGPCGNPPVAPQIAVTSSLQGQVFYTYPSDGKKIDVAITSLNPAEAPIDSVKYYVVDLGCDGPGCATIRKFTVKTAPFGLNIDPVYSAYASKYNTNTQIDVVAFSKGVASENKTLLIRLEPLPELAIVSPANNSSIAKNAVSIPVDVTVNSSQIPIDSVVYIVKDTKTTGMSGFTTTRKFVVLSPYDFSIPVLAGQTYTRISALAYADNQKTSKPLEIQVTYNNPPVAPQIAVTSSLQNVLTYTYPSDGKKIDVTITSLNPTEAPIDSVKYYVIDLGCDGPGCATIRKFTVKTAPFDLNIDPVYSAYASQYNTNTQIDVVAFSKGIASENKTILIKLKPLPELAIVSPANNSSIAKNAVSIPVDVTVNSSQIPIDSVVYIVKDTKTTGMSDFTTTRKFVVLSPYNFSIPVLAGQTYTRISALAYYNQKTSKPLEIQVTYNNPPVISITSPLPVNGINPKYLVGGSITVSANVTDSDGVITKVEISRAGTVVDMVTLTAAPYTATFTNLPMPYPDGSYSFNVRAYDNSGGITDQLIVVYRNRVPSISITSPAPNASYSSGTTVVVTTAPYDPDFTSGKIEYFNGTTKLGESVFNSTLPSPTINFSLTGLAVGNYALTAKITDDMGESAVSSVVNFTVTGGSTCTDPAWVATSAYPTGSIVSRLGKRYKAAYWSQGAAPETHSGPYQEWIFQSNCGSSRLAEASAVSSVSVYPNPFISDASVVLELAAADEISITVFNTYGVKIGTIFSGTLEAGTHSFTLNTPNLSAGVYIVRVSGASISDKVTVIKN